MTPSEINSPPGMASDLCFANVVLVRVEGRWHTVKTVDQALHCLRNVFPDKTGPSFRRAMNTCEAARLGIGAVEGAQATFVVAAMEGGHPFETHEEGAELEERLVVAAVENGLLDMLLELDKGRS